MVTVAQSSCPATSTEPLAASTLDMQQSDASSGSLQLSAGHAKIVAQPMQQGMTDFQQCWCAVSLLQDICIVELREPIGWIVVPLTAAATSGPGGERPVQAFFYQVGPCGRSRQLACHS